MTPRTIVRVVRMLVAGTLLACLFAAVGLRAVAEAFSGLTWWWVPLLLLIRILALLLQSQRWRLFLADHGIRASSVHLLKSYWIARFFNNFLPGQLGGDAYRILYGLNPSVSKAQVASTVLVERIAGLIGLMLIAAVGGYAGSELIRGAGLGLLPVAAAAMAVGLFIVVIRPTPATSLAALARALPISRLSRGLARLASSLLVHVEKRATLLIGIVLSAGFYSLFAFESFLALRAFGVDIDLAAPLVIAPTIALVMSLPITMNGWGTAEVASVLLYTQVGVPEADALSMALLSRVNYLLMSGMGGLLYLWQSWHAPVQSCPTRPA